jgi:hypothetical protein
VCAVGITSLRFIQNRSSLAAATLCIAATSVLVAGCGGENGDSGTPIPQPSVGQLRASGLSDIPVAPDSARVDLTAPPFSSPTEVTNPLFPISDLHSAVLNGRIDGLPFHTETTLLRNRRAVAWPPGEQTETLVSQYMAFLDGRLQEVALDYYAQADDGSVWYFGEDVSDYTAQGFVAFTTDSWLAGKDGPPAMIMPADPQIGQAFRTENIPGVVFEEVTVKKLDQTLPGPAGPVHGVMDGQELHDDGATSEKLFAPGYGEFFTHDSDGTEAMALAVPKDALDEPVPPELEAVLAGADRAFDAVEAKDWPSANGALRKAAASWSAFQRANQAPPRLKAPLDRALAVLAPALDARDQTRAGTAAIDVSQAALDLELRYLLPSEIDAARFHEWARQLVVDADARDLGGVRGDLVTLGWIRDRFFGSIDPIDQTRIDTNLLALQGGVDSRNFAELQSGAAKLEQLAGSLSAAG